jgi:NAD(P)-dependent dehydrogenase (short-subunit alcohol dehydrogenase family)
VVTEAPEGDPGSRRRLVERAAAGLAAAGAAALLAACGKQSLHDQLKQQPEVARADVEILRHLLDVERLGIAAYTAAAPLLPTSAALACKQFLAQELAHAGGLIGLISAAGRKAPDPRPSYDLGRPRDTHEVLRLLQWTEQIQVSSYLDALPRLVPGAVRTQASGFFANDAQHLSSVRFLLGEPPLSALVTGRD